MPAERPQPPLPTIRRGSGAPLVLLHGFAMAPATYAPTMRLLAERMHVLAPMWLYVEGDWSYRRAVQGLDAAVDAAGLDGPVTVLGHSAGGALALALAARRPDMVARMVLVNTMGASSAEVMRRNAMPGRHLLRLASLRATRDFFGTVFTRPRDVGRAALWAYRHDPSEDIAAVRAADVRTHVLWAERDALLPLKDGRRFAERLGASFMVVSAPAGTAPIDHDWVARRPRLFVETLTDLDLLPAVAGRSGA